MGWKEREREGGSVRAYVHASIGYSTLVAVNVLAWPIAALKLDIAERGIVDQMRQILAQIAHAAMECVLRAVVIAVAVAAVTVATVASPPSATITTDADAVVIVSCAIQGTVIICRVTRSHSIMCRACGTLSAS